METLHYLLMADHTMVQKALIASIRDTGLTPGQPKILDYLRTHDGSIQRELAEGCHIEPASLSVLLGGMEEKGYIERRTQNGNRRSLYVFLTEKGRKCADMLEQHFQAIESAAQDGLDEREKETLRVLLSRIYEKLMTGKT